MSYQTLDAPAEHREDVKGSVFLAFADRADAPEAALDCLHGLARRHADATHLCWAYRIGPSYRFADAGEPSGTAGQPIYRAIEGQTLDHVVVAVVRYFGGTKLGAGGLARAYGGAAAEVLRRAPKRTEWPRRWVDIRVPFTHLGTLYHILDTLGVKDRSESYDARGVSVRAAIGEDDVERLAVTLRNATRDEGSLALADPG